MYYKEEDGTLVKAGQEFRGFPAEGVWLVHDGVKGPIMRIGDTPDPMCVASLERHRFALELKMASIMAKWRQGEEMSPKRVVSAMLETMAAATCRD
jgi:hypothetical protein